MQSGVPRDEGLMMMKMMMNEKRSQLEKLNQSVKVGSDVQLVEILPVHVYCDRLRTYKIQTCEFQSSSQFNSVIKAGLTDLTTSLKMSTSDLGAHGVQIQNESLYT